jgi:predicted transcriptional regulator
MEELLQELVGILRQKHACFQEFLDLIKKEREVIIRHRTEDLQKMISSQEEILEKTSQLEKERIQLVDRMAARLQVSAQDLTMSKIIEKAPEPMKSTCQQLYRQISLNLEEIERVNKTNAELVKGSLNNIDSSLRA